MRGRAFIGTSGWNYRGWVGPFYPKPTRPARLLEVYAEHFDSVEVNNTFYRLPEKTVFEAWRKQSPPNFTFAVKASRFFTHMKKLAHPEIHGALLLNRAKGLRGKLGVILFQLPRLWKFNGQRLEDLGAYLNRQRILPGVRAALEVRNPTWLSKECYQILSRHNIALAFADWPGVDVQKPLTADFVFLRRHGPGPLYASSYPEASLRREAWRIRRWLSQGRDVYAYFNNDVNAYAVHNARALRRWCLDKR